jgi:redox-sensitive bicupin YhaK (pirin superfamily)
MGTRETIHRGSVQFMTAGTGVRHSEHNLHETKPCRFIQTWILPRARNLPPNYGSLCVDDSNPSSPSYASCFEIRHNKWAHLCSEVANTSASTPVKINQDCNMFVTESDVGVDVPPLKIESGRQAYMLCMEGAAEVNALTAVGERVANVNLARHDAAEIIGPVTIQLRAGQSGDACHVLVFEMAYASQAHGRSDL